MRSTKISLLLVLGQAINGALSAKVVDRWPIKRIAKQPVFSEPESSLNPRNIFPLSSLSKRACDTLECDGTCCGDICTESIFDDCCDGYYCKDGTECCNDGCMPSYEECCKGEGYCIFPYTCSTVNGEAKCCEYGDCDDGQAGIKTADKNLDPDTASKESNAYTTTITVSLIGGPSTTTTVTVTATDPSEATSTFGSISDSIFSDLLSSKYDSPTRDGLGGGDFDLPTDFPGGSDNSGGGSGGSPGERVPGMGGNGVYPYPAGVPGGTAGAPWKSGFSHWYTTVYAGMIVVPALLAAYI